MPRPRLSFLPALTLSFALALACEPSDKDPAYSPLDEWPEDTDTGEVDLDGDGVFAEDDCDDSDGDTFPGAAENDSETACMTDADGDGWGDESPDFLEVEAGTDCDDTDEDTFPGAAENDSETACMTDSDGDGWGYDSTQWGIDAGTDCDDNDDSLGSVSEDADCDGTLTADDCDDSDVSLNEEDEDADGYSACDGDCDDTDEDTFPGAAENDSETACMTDTDGDGWGDMSPTGSGDRGTDCDDGDASVESSAEDGDCDGTLTEDDCDDSDASLNADDIDGDGTSTCEGDCDDSDPALNADDIDGDGYSTCEDDCDDSDSETHPDAVDVPGDGLDQDCNGLESVDCSVATTYDGDVEWPSDDGMCDPTTPYLVDGSLIIDGGWSGATDMTGAYCLCEISGNVELADNEDLVNLYGLTSLRAIGGDLVIGYYETDEYQEFEWVTDHHTGESKKEFGDYVCDLDTYGNEQLESLEGLDDLESIGGDLQILANDNLTSLEGLENLESIGGSLILGSEWSCDASTYIIENRSLSTLVGLESLTTVGGDIAAYYSFPGFIGLENLTSIGGSLDVVSAEVLENFNGLESLENIGGSLSYTTCAMHTCSSDSLQDFSGLENLTTIGVDLRIDESDVLTDVSSLHGITSVGEDIRITDNTELLTEDAEALRDAIGTDNIGGTVTISGNK